MMEEQEQTFTLGPGMLGCDREVFAQVWQRVSPGENAPVEPLPVETSPVETVPQDPPPSQPLQALVLASLSDASVYQDLRRRTRRSNAELAQLAQRKIAHAKRLSAAYFLLSGVRYWPREVTPVNPPDSFFPTLRDRFLAEKRRWEELTALSAQETQEPELRALYAELAQETQELIQAIWRIVEKET